MLCVKLVKGLHEPYQSLSSGSMNNRTVRKLMDWAARVTLQNIFTLLMRSSFRKIVKRGQKLTVEKLGGGHH